MTTLELLQRVTLFAELSPDDLGRMAARSRIEAVATGACVIEEGSPPDALYVVADGELEVHKRGPTGPTFLNRCGPGDLIGELSALESRPRTASVTATRDSRLIVLPIDALHDVLRSSLAAVLSILRTVASRLANTEAVLRQQDTLASLGRIAAGLAHEFNNPASAVKRGAAELRDRVPSWEQVAFDLRTVALDSTQLAALHRLAAEPRPLPVIEDGMRRAERERALEAGLARVGIAQAWELAPALAGAGWDLAALDEVAAAFPAAALPTVLRWIEATATWRALTGEVADAAGRISELVHAVRAHSYLGQGPIQDVDLHAGLDDSLRLMRHRFASIALRRDYAADLPRIEGYGSELNQVWSNLIDNALQAMGGSGDLVVATRRAGDRVTVEIADTGPGIPAALQDQVFKPFFTTKPPGEGTGLGLHLSYNVVVRKHRGEIEFESRPGRTWFRIALPIRRTAEVA